jgi:hypothetical protein
MKRILLFSVAFLLTYPSFVFADSCIDNQGNTYYTNKPCPDGATPQGDSPPPAQSSALEFRGIPMGMSMDRVFYALKDDLIRSDETYAKLAALEIDDNAFRKAICPYSNACETFFHIKGVSVKVRFGFQNDVLTHLKMYYSPQRYGTLRNALIDKYGKPTEMKNEVTAWILPGGFISIHKSTSEGTVYMLSNEYIAYSRQKKEADKHGPGF